MSLASEEIMVATELSLSSFLQQHAEWLENPNNGRRADLSGLTFNEQQAVKANLRKVLAVGATFLDAHLNESDLSESRLTRADFQRADLTGADLTKADVTDANFSGAWMAGANLSEINAKETNFRRVKWKGARLMDASMHVVRCDECSAEGASFHQ